MSTVIMPRFIVELKYSFMFRKTTKKSEPSYLAFMLEQKGTSFHKGFLSKPTFLNL